MGYWELKKLVGLNLNMNGLYNSYRGMAWENYNKFCRAGKHTVKKFLYVFRAQLAGLYAIQTRMIEPNINIRSTGCAGSIYSLGVLTGWALCTHIMDELGIEAELVVARAEIRYRAPVNGELECSCACSEVQC